MKSEANRYVGIDHFSSEQNNIFFGRDEDIEKLNQLVSTQQQVLLYSKSGLGKSSLINAGLIPLLKRETPSLKIIQIRFTAFQENQIEAYKAGRLLTPIGTILSEIPKNPSFIDKVWDGSYSLWSRLKSQQLNNISPSSNFIFIFDQFEELFTYPEEDIYDFKKQFAEVLYDTLPKNFEKVLSIRQKRNPDILSDEELRKLYHPLNIKTLMAIREDRYSQLNLLNDFLPDAMHNRYALEPLSVKQAELAIVLPAQQIGNFDSEPFEYTNEAINGIINYLTQEGTKSIETAQLQILCSSLEKLKIKQIGLKDIPKFGDIFLEFYLDVITSFPKGIRVKIRSFLENELIKKGQRISLDRLFCQEFISYDILQKLVKNRLLRSVPNTLGGISYELSHDTLVAPITEAKQIREKQEAKEEEELKQAEKLKEVKQKAEHNRKEKEKAIRRLRQTRIAFTLIIILLMISVIGIWYALDQKALADQAQIETRKLLDKNRKDAFDRFFSESNFYAKDGKYKEAIEKLKTAQEFTNDSTLINQEIRKIDSLKEMNLQFDEFMRVAFENSQNIKYDKAIQEYKKAISVYEELSLSNQLFRLNSSLKELQTIISRNADKQLSNAKAVDSFDKQAANTYKREASKLNKYRLQLDELLENLN